VISFRQLVVTIVSIFLALGLGILAGTTIIDQSLVHNLRQQTRNAERTAAAEGKQLREATSLLDGIVPFVVQAKLAHRKVILVADSNVDGGALSEVGNMLRQAKADVVAQLETTESFAPNNPARANLAQLLAQDGQAIEGDPTVSAAKDLADRLATGPPATDPQTGKPLGHDLLVDLLSAGYLDFPHTSPPDPQEVGGAGQVVVVVTGGKRDPAVPFESFMMPFVQQLATRAVPIGVGEPRATTHSLVELVRADGSLAGIDNLATVDDLSSNDPRGGVALILALRDLLRAQPHGGNYGEKSGADGLLPSVS